MRLSASREARTELYLALKIPEASGRMAAVKIRDPTLDDLPAIVEIYNSTVPSRMVTADPEPVSVERDLIVLVLSLDGTG